MVLRDEPDEGGDVVARGRHGRLPSRGEIPFGDVTPDGAQDNDASGVAGPGLDDWEISDDELTALALAGDPGTGLGPDAVPISFSGLPSLALLPQWYMPQVMLRGGGRWR